MQNSCSKNKVQCWGYYLAEEFAKQWLQDKGGRERGLFMDSSGVSKGGKCWFAVESKMFEISIVMVQGKLRGLFWRGVKAFPLG